VTRPRLRKIFWDYVHFIKDVIEENGLVPDNVNASSGKHPTHKWWCSVFPPAIEDMIFSIRLSLDEKMVRLKIFDHQNDVILSHSSVNRDCDSESIRGRFKLDIEYAIEETAGVLDRIAWEADSDATSRAEDAGHRP